LGAAEFLTKPVERSQLVGLLQRYAGGGLPGRALVVDDQPTNRDLLRAALEAEGWEVVEAENGQEGLERVESDAPTLILLDLMMPVMDGFEFVAEMRKRDAEHAVPIVVVTAKDVTEDDRRRLTGGVAGLIRKDGLDHDTLLDQLRGFVDTVG